MNNEELKEILEKHKKYLDDAPDGERANLFDANLRNANLCDADLCDADLCNANLCNANLRNANLCYANLCNADLCNANLCDANLRNANLGGADLGGANIDYSCLPLWCGSLRVHFDNKQMIQILYHLLYIVSFSKYASKELKKTLLTPGLCELANKFHRVDECGKISPYVDLPEEAA